MSSARNSRWQIDVTDRTFSIKTEFMNGFLRVYMDRGEPTGQLARFLSGTLSGWTEQHPEMRLVAVVPINRDGDTVERHAWFEQRE